MSVRRAMKRATAGTRTFYHFTPPFNLPSIIKNGIYPFSDQHGNDHMLPGAAAIWLTANPNGNQVTEAHLAYYRKCGKLELIADYETGRQRWMFGCNEGGSARITVRLPKNFRGLANYIELLTANYRESAPAALAAFAEIPGVADWWIVMSPAIGKTFTGIGPGAITEMCPVGEQTPAYAEAFKEIQKWASAEAA